MKRFVALFQALDATTRTSGKTEALAEYFRKAESADAAWALAFLAGQRLPRPITSSALRALAAEAAALPGWLVEECHEAVGDLAETLALLVDSGDAPAPDPIPLARFVEERILPLSRMGEAERNRLILRTWRELDAPSRFLFNKLITGAFRVGVSRTLVLRALAGHAGIAPALIAHRFMGGFEPTAEAFARLIAPEGERLPTSGAATPFPFCLAHALEEAVEALGPPGDWFVEYKWDGIRAQVLCRGAEVLIWSRGEELITDRFPEIAAAARTLPRDCAMDGELLAWDPAMARPLPFTSLQPRIGRKRLTADVVAAIPVRFIAYDLLEEAGADLRARPLRVRRERLAALLVDSPSALGLSAPLAIDTWDDATRARADARTHGVEGLMLKRADSAYGSGRMRGDWWKWKVDPFTLDGVLLAAQPGHGRRAGLFTDYTFGIWRGAELVPFAKAYSGLTDEELVEVDRFVRRHTTGRGGPVRFVKPELVFEVAFEAIQRSPRHRAGFAVRFPRILRWRRDKPASEADTIETLEGLLRLAGEPPPASSRRRGRARRAASASASNPPPELPRFEQEDLFS